MENWRQRAKTPKQIARHVKHLCGEDLEDREPKLTLLIGAGCSVSAGIPSASAIVRDHLRPHPLLRDIGPAPSGMSEYAWLMSELPAEDRMAIIERCIAEANHATVPRTQINWAHLLIATLVRHRFVKQILTTNFDPLLIDVMALTDQPIRTFDLTAADWYMPGRANRGSIMYLHGQSHGLLQAHTSDDTEKARPRIRDALKDALTDSTMIVLGYSGDCDPVFDELRVGFPQFRNRLYWVHFDSEGKDPPEQILEFLNDGSREAYAVLGTSNEQLDADTFMDRFVVDGLKLDLLPLISDPLDHTESAISRICGGPYREHGQEKVAKPVETAREYVTSARQRMRQSGTVPPSDPESQDAESRVPSTDSKPPLELQIELAAMTSDIEKLRAIRDEAKGIASDAVQSRLDDAYLTIASAMAQSDPDLAEQILDESRDLKTSEPEWRACIAGVIRHAKAQSVPEEEALRLLHDACREYERAIQLKPEMPEALYNWGNALGDQAKLKTGPESDALFESACKKFAAALEINPEMHEALYNWGNALGERAKLKTGPASDALFESACKKFAAALEIKPDKHEALYNWGTTLCEQATLNTGPTSDALLESACKKFAAALEIKPDFYDARSNWGTALMEQAKLKTGSEADALYELAFEKFGSVLETKPSHHTTLFNCACHRALCNDASGSIEFLTRWKAAHPHAKRDEIDNDDDFDQIRDDPAFVSFLESHF